MIKSQITLKDSALEIRTTPVIKKALTKVRGDPSLHELEELLLVKGVNTLQINVKDVKGFNTYLIKRSSKDLKNLFEISDRKPYLILLSISLSKLTYKIILSYNDGIRLKKFLSAVKEK